MRLKVSAFASVQEAINACRDKIDVAAGKARSRYLTVVPGQDATYSAKYADAKAFIMGGALVESVDSYPWVKAEAAATGKTYEQAAQGIKAVGDPWNFYIGPAIEQLRIGGKQALDSLTTVDAVVASARTTTDQLDAI